jgi:hypothetical protein
MEDPAPVPRSALKAVVEQLALPVPAMVMEEMAALLLLVQARDRAALVEFAVARRTVLLVLRMAEEVEEALQALQVEVNASVPQVAAGPQAK